MPGGGVRGKDRRLRVLWRHLAGRRVRQGWRWSAVRPACLPVREGEEDAQGVHGPRGESLKLSVYSRVAEDRRGKETAWRTRIREGSGSFRGEKRWSRSR